MGIVAEPPVKPTALHERDFHAWTEQQAALLRARKFGDLDVDNLIEEILDMGRSEAAALESALTQALIHLLKLSCSPAAAPCASWEVSVVKQRVEIGKLLKANPGLQSRLTGMFEDAWIAARKIARAELAEYKEFPDLPATCPFDLATVRDETFSPIGPQTKTN